ncbi:maltose alpha-D-glucosyltransferase [uncultured Aquabacterium sp.]|uniref:maltose alpha-D-glucosyltransferase n=1 Tax=uncultured Aquabacterium sp. TaxID=158753 RepID=UPI00261BDE48|nr:maltose alpha-D-glucosyltransferase [uncultured Aquabacterium sp.]
MNMLSPDIPHLEEAAQGATVPRDDQALWYKDAVIYQLNVKAFFDADENGIGDFNGVTARLDYIKDLGVNAIWVMPFYPSPLRDDGYDISGYEEIHPCYGTLDDFKRMLDEVHKRDLKLITELVINHTSDQHPWFQAARRAPPGSPERDFYVWSDTDTRYPETRIIFTDTETSNWTWDPVAKAYYWHRFFSHQPDLNFDNPAVLEAVFKVMRFWLDMGVDGFRLDAIPYLIERDGTNNENLPETHAIIKQLRAAIDANYENRFLLAEANQWPEDVRDYFGEGDECHAAYHFPLMPRMYMAIAQENRFPVVEIMRQTPAIPDSCQWAIFLRNHDELTLEMVTSKERDYMYNTYAADPRARINLGIRRRLAPLMENNIDTIKLMNSLLLSMPGSPIIYYGDEIGMGDNVYLGDRNGVRTPMQWSPDRNAGFSRADPQKLYLPPIMDAVYGYQAVNVEAQLRDPSSLLNWMRRMLAVRKSSHAFGRGALTFLKPGNPKILAYLREYEDDTILCVANLARSAQPVELNLSRYKGRVPVELLGRTLFPPIGELPYLLTIAAHGFYWFRLDKDAGAPSWHEEHVPMEDVPVLVLFDSWRSFFPEMVVPWRSALAVKTRAQLEEQVLPRHIETQRWYAAKGQAIERASLRDHVMWTDGARSWLITLVDVQSASDGVSYFMPLAKAWEEQDEERTRALAMTALARTRQHAQVGVMADAFSDAAFCRAVVRAMGQGLSLPTSGGTLRFEASAVYDALLQDKLDSLPVSKPLGQSSNTVVTLDETLFLKGYRAVRPGPSLEYEVGRFLTEVARFEHIVPVAGLLTHQAPDGTERPLAILQGYIGNQGDGWAYTAGYLERHLERSRSMAEAEAQDVHAAFLDLIRTLGRRTAELHAAFATPSGDPLFEPEALTAADVTAIQARVRADVARSLDLLSDRQPDLPAEVRDAAAAVLAGRDALIGLIERPLSVPAGAQRIRCHGDYHLGQVLVTANDFVIIDFEGEPARPIDERRTKQPPWLDVAGMLRSFSYARLGALRSAVHSAEEQALLGPIAEAWEQQVRDAFLAGYVEPKAPEASDPADSPPPAAKLAGHDAALLTLFELEKALYELRYELHSRPDWVAIPLAGLLQLLAREAV